MYILAYLNVGTTFASNSFRHTKGNFTANASENSAADVCNFIHDGISPLSLKSSELKGQIPRSLSLWSTCLSSASFIATCSYWQRGLRAPKYVWANICGATVVGSSMRPTCRSPKHKSFLTERTDWPLSRQHLDWYRSGRCRFLHKEVSDHMPDLVRRQHEEETRQHCASGAANRRLRCSGETFTNLNLKGLVT